MKKVHLKPFLKKLFIAFVLIAGLPLICVNILNHLVMTRLYTSELGESYKEKLRIADTVVNLWEEEMIKQTFIISMNEYQDLLSAEDITPGKNPSYEHINNIKRFSSLLESIVSTNDKYYSIWVFYENSELLISSSNSLADNETGYSFEELLNLCSAGNIWISWGDDKKNLSYVVPLPQYVSRNTGFIIFNLKENTLNNVINGGIGETGAGVFIINSKGMVLSDINKNNIGGYISDIPIVMKILADSKETNFFTDRNNGQDIYVVYRRSAIRNWYFCSFIPAGELSTRTRVIFLVSIVMIFGFLLLTIAFSYISAKRLNMPMEKLEYRLEDYNLMRLLSGTGNARDLSVNINMFPLDYFCCVVLYLDYYSRTREELGEDKIEEYKTKLQRICKDGVQSNLYCESLTPERNSVVMMINCEESDALFLPATVRKIQAEALSAFGISVSAGIGKLCSARDIYASYNSARQAILYRFISGPGSLIEFKENMELAKRYFYPYNKERIIFNHLHLHSFDETSGALAEFFRAIKDENNISVDNAIQICNQLLGEIIKYIVLLGISSNVLFHDDHNLYSRLSKFEFIDDIQSFFKEIAEKIVHFEKSGFAQNKRPIEMIIAYIKNNYNKPFDLNKLADEIGLSYSHVRRIFTKETGENILTYVYRIKIEEVKKILRESEVSITEIPEKLGFYNKQSFFRFFKKFEGITPNKYRELENNRTVQ